MKGPLIFAELESRSEYPCLVTETRPILVGTRHIHQLFSSAIEVGLTRTLAYFAVRRRIS